MEIDQAYLRTGTAIGSRVSHSDFFCACVLGVSKVGGSTLKRHGSQSAIGQPSASKQR